VDAFYCNDPRPYATTTSTFCLGTTRPSTKPTNPRSAKTHCRKIQHRGRRPESLSEWESQIVGGRYSAMLPPQDLSNLPPAAKAAISACRAKFVTTDRGHVRRANDRSIDTRCQFFAKWLQSGGHTKQSASLLTQDQLIDTIGAFLDDIKAGNNLQSIHLSSQSLRNYTTAAAMCFKLLTGTTAQYYDPATMLQKRIYLHPFLQDKIVQRQHWSAPTQQKEPFTYCMLKAHAQHLLKPCAKDSFTQFYSLNHVVWDWLRLGVFTGSRVAEYAQSGLKRNQRYQCIPNTKDAAKWAGQPFAFIRADFQFYDVDNCCVPHKHVLTLHRQHQLRTVHIRFRFDKSKNNFVIRKFDKTSDPILNPVDAAVSILRRADMLNVPPHEPIGVYTVPGAVLYSFLRDYHITPILRNMCCLAYPDPTHYLRIHIERLVPHSNRVTAAVCLKMGGATDEDIAFRLRWNIASVPTYLRECFQEVGPIMMTTLQGAFKTS
jgi:hypothetical protein